MNLETALLNLSEKSLRVATGTKGEYVIPRVLLA